MGDNRDEPEGLDDGSRSAKTQTPDDGQASNQSVGKKTSPIEIKQAQGGKFGVINCRPPTDSSGLIVDSNGEPVPLDSIIKTANTMSNIMMAHKIALEDDFKLEPGMDISGPLMSLSPIIGSSSPRAQTSSGVTQEPNLQSRVKDIVLEAYWDLLKEELDSQKCDSKEDRKYDLSKQLLRDIKQKIIDLLLPQHARLKQDIEDRLDSKILDQLSRVESLNLIDYAKYILEILSKLCAPVRDEKLKELTETKDVVHLYRGIMELLELMRLDFANFTLNRFKPHIKAHSQEYEREKFNEILKQQQNIGIDGLEYTKLWLERAVKRVDELHGISDLLNEYSSSEYNIEDPNMMTSSINIEKRYSNNKRDKILGSSIVNKVLNAAYSELLEWSSDKQKLYPETLLFDEATFKQLGEQYKILVITSSVLLTSFAFVNRFKLRDDNDFREKIKSHVITLITASYQDSQPVATGGSPKPSPVNSDDALDQAKLETITTRLSEDIREKLEEIDKASVESFNSQSELFRRQILDLQSPTNRVRDLARRRILEFVETLLALDVEHQQKKTSIKSTPPVNIPLGLNCLTNEITLTMAQLVKIVRYNRRVFFQHYEAIIVELVLKNS